MDLIILDHPVHSKKPQSRQLPTTVVDHPAHSKIDRSLLQLPSAVAANDCIAWFLADSSRGSSKAPQSRLQAKFSIC
jgi:hypothetical protein